MGPGRDRTRDPWNCCQTRICCQTHYRLHYAARSSLLGDIVIASVCLSMICFHTHVRCARAHLFPPPHPHPPNSSIMHNFLQRLYLLPYQFYKETCTHNEHTVHIFFTFEDNRRSGPYIQFWHLSLWKPSANILRMTSQSLRLKW